ncbi:MAG: tetratricopeptide repeat protein, partial [Calditrichaeota bacterium]|nr:tetratricopeptide repeat protein [Calditrichota bacterium]
EFFFDIDKAIEIYLQVAQKYNRDSAIRERAYRSAGESYIMRGDLDNAARILQKVTAPEEKPQAAYDLARIAFFRGEYAEARNHLNTIITVEGLSGSTVNDVLALQGI